MTRPVTDRTDEQLINGLCNAVTMLTLKLDKISPKDFGDLQESKAEIIAEILRRLKGEQL